MPSGNDRYAPIRLDGMLIRSHFGESVITRRIPHQPRRSASAYRMRVSKSKNTNPTNPKATRTSPEEAAICKKESPVRVAFVGVPRAVLTALVSIYVGIAMAKKKRNAKRAMNSGAGEKKSFHQEK